MPAGDNLRFVSERDTPSATEHNKIVQALRRQTCQPGTFTDSTGTYQRTLSSKKEGYRRYKGTTTAAVAKDDETFTVNTILATDGGSDPDEDAEWEIANPSGDSGSGFCIDEGAVVYFETDSSLDVPDDQDAAYRVYDAPCGSDCS